MNLYIYLQFIHSWHGWMTVKSNTRSARLQYFLQKEFKRIHYMGPFSNPTQNFFLNQSCSQVCSIFFHHSLMDPHSPTLLLSITPLLDLSSWSFFCFGPCWLLILFPLHLRLYTHRTLIIHACVWTPVACEHYLKYFSDFFPLGLRIKF